MPATSMRPMADQAALLRLLTWLSPAFPTGAYAYSHGLEWSVDAGDVTDGASLRAWIEDLLAYGSARSDAILLRHAHRAAPDAERLAAIAELAATVAPARERQAETLDLGAAFALAAAVWHEIPPAPYPVAVGVLTARSGIGEDDAAAVYLQAVAANLVSAGVRLIPLGQSAGLAVI